MEEDCDTYQEFINLKDELYDAIYDYDEPDKFIKALTTYHKLTHNQPISSDFVKYLIYHILMTTKKKVIEAFINYFEYEAKNDPQKQLILALFKGDIQEVELLLNSGVSLEGGAWKDDDLPDLPAIHSIALFSTSCSARNMLKLLIKHGLDVKIKNDKDQNLLHALSNSYQFGGYYDASKTAEIIFNAGVPIDEVDNDGCAPLFYAAGEINDLDLVKFFIDKGADVNRRDKYGRFPLKSAVTKDHDGTITDLLISSGADVNAKEGSTARTALHWACIVGSKSDIDVLLKHGADICAKEKHGFTPYVCLSHYREEYDGCKLSMIKEFAKIFLKSATKLEDLLLYEQSLSENSFLNISFKDMALVLKTPKTSKIFNKALLEIIRMKKMIFYSPYSYYSVLSISKNIKKLSKLTRNKEFVAKFKANLDSFPIFKEDLIKNFNAAIKDKKDSALVISRLNSVFKRFLPDVVIRMVAESLTVRDLPEQ